MSTMDIICHDGSYSVADGFQSNQEHGVPDEWAYQQQRRNDLEFDLHDASDTDWYHFLTSDPMLCDVLQVDSTPMTLSPRALDDTDDTVLVESAVDPGMIMDLEPKVTRKTVTVVTGGNSHKAPALPTKVSMGPVKREPRTIKLANQMKSGPFKSKSMVIQSNTCRPGTAPQQSLLKARISPSGKTIISTRSVSQNHKVVTPICIKQEPEDSYMNTDLPMTPPSSASSDSDTLSPPASPRQTVRHHVLITKPYMNVSASERSAAAAFYSQPIPTSGILLLSEEEKRLFVQEGYPIPSRLPLNKIDERNMKKVRRKIKNKISAQESRRKKKEYMDQLEKQVSDISRENSALRRKVETYESSNRSLIAQLNKLQKLVKQYTSNVGKVSAQTGTCVMVLVLCFAIFLSNWSPTFSLSSITTSYTSHALDYTTPAMRSSRTLMMSSETEDSACPTEPWPIYVVKHSINAVSQFVFNYPLIDTSSQSSHYMNTVNTLYSPAQPSLRI